MVGRELLDLCQEPVWGFVVWARLLVQYIMLWARAMLIAWWMLLLVDLVEPELLDVREGAVRNVVMFGSLLCEGDLLWAWPMSGIRTL
jgi:hypothetical protein